MKNKRLFAEPPVDNKAPYKELEAGRTNGQQTEQSLGAGFTGHDSC
jgi:hypothetical protein